MGMSMEYLITGPVWILANQTCYRWFAYHQTLAMERNAPVFSGNNWRSSWMVSFRCPARRSLDRGYQRGYFDAQSVIGKRELQQEGPWIGATCEDTLMLSQ